MKLLLYTIIILISIPSSCQNNDTATITLNYTAQTRGFLYTINVYGANVEINSNGHIKSGKLQNEQLETLQQIIDNINFNTIKNTTLPEDMAVDKTIEGVFEIQHKGKENSFKINHQHPPTEIKKIFDFLESILG
jgi:hypothetical protein